MLIEGVAFPVGVLNANGQGVPLSEVDNAIASLQKAVLRICPRNEPEGGHSCDFRGDPKSEIGRFIEAWHDTSVNPSVIRTIADVSDSIAAQKISDGVWENTWSFFGSGNEDDHGWIHNFYVEAMTLVRDPAWKEAQFKVLAAAAGDNPLKWRFDASMAVKADKTGGKKMADKKDEKPEDVFDRVKLETQIKDMMAEHKKELDAKDVIIASKNTEIATLKADSSKLLTQEAATKLAEKIAAEKIEEFKVSQKADQEKAVAFAEHMTVAVAAGLDEAGEKARLEKFSAAEIKAQTEIVRSVAASVGKDLPTYKASPKMDGDNGLTVGNFIDGKWQDQ
jgi:hypothetical protein